MEGLSTNPAEYHKIDTATQKFNKKNVDKYCL